MRHGIFRPQLVFAITDLEAIAEGVLEENGIVCWAVLRAFSRPADVPGARVLEQFPYIVDSFPTLRPEGNPIGVGLMVLVFGEPKPGLVGQFPVGVEAAKALARPALFKPDGGEDLRVERPGLLEAVDPQVDMLKGILLQYSLASLSVGLGMRQILSVPSASITDGGPYDPRARVLNEKDCIQSARLQWKGVRGQERSGYNPLTRFMRNSIKRQHGKAMPSNSTYDFDTISVIPCMKVSCAIRAG